MFGLLAGIAGALALVTLVLLVGYAIVRDYRSHVEQREMLTAADEDWSWPAR